MHAATSAKRKMLANKATEKTHDMQDALRDVLIATVRSGPVGESGTDSIQYRACAVLYLLLCDHPVDGQGRCQRCRRRGAVLGRRRRECRIYLAASFWLRQPDEVVLGHFASELDHRRVPVRGTRRRPERCSTTRVVPADDPDATEVLSRIYVDPCTHSLQTLSVQTPLCRPGGASPTRPPALHSTTTGSTPSRTQEWR